MGRMNKICFKCNELKELNEFYEHPQMPDGHVNKCKECNKKDVRLNYAENIDQKHEYDRRRQRHSRTRIFNHRYGQIKQRVEGRAVRKYGVEGKEILSYEEYCMWIKNNIDAFEEVYSKWRDSNFERRLTPSIDRINNDGSYTADNMRWVSVSVNSSKSNKRAF